MIKVIYDCDNTMGVHECDVDDGLTLLYLLGRKEIELLGVTTTYGNSTIDIVHSNTNLMFSELNIKNIPICKGAPSPINRISPASEFLVETVKRYPGEIIILATGSLTNLYGAYLIDNSFFSYVKEIVLMGGITHPLIINGKKLDELNFSCDPDATYHVLDSGSKVTILTGHICLQAMFSKNEYDRLMDKSKNRIYKYIQEKTFPWFEFIKKEFNIDGFYNWDIVAAVYITNPELFDNKHILISSTPKDLAQGLLLIEPNKSNPLSYNVNIPNTIKDVSLFNELIFSAWEYCEIKLFNNI